MKKLSGQQYRNLTLMILAEYKSPKLNNTPTNRHERRAMAKLRRK